MLINQEWLRLFFFFFFFFCHRSIRSHPEAAAFRSMKMFCFFFNIILKKKRFSWHYFFFLSFHMGGGGRLGCSYLPCRIPSSSLFRSHICSCPCCHVLTSGVCIFSGLFNTCMLHNLTTQAEERNIGSVQDILLKLRHQSLSLSLSLSLFLSATSLGYTQPIR